MAITYYLASVILNVLKQPVQNHFCVGRAGQCCQEGVSEWTELPIASDSVDMLVLSHVVAQGADTPAFWQEIHRILRHDGMVVVTAFNPWRRLSQRIGRMAYGQRWQGTLLTLKQLKRQLEAADLSVKQSKRYGYFTHSSPVSNSWLQRLSRWCLPDQCWLYGSGAQAIGPINTG